MQTTSVTSSLARRVTIRPRAVDAAAQAPGRHVTIVRAQKCINRRQTNAGRQGNSNALVGSRILGGSRLALAAPSTRHTRHVIARVTANFS